ncbi:MAG TPA: nitroreductase [Reyranella sp.]
MDHAIIPAAAQRDERLRAVELLLSRQSANLLQEPAPEGAELDLILDAGLRAPDHGRLRPWRFVLIRGEQRQAWAERLDQAAQARDPVNGQAMGEKSRAWVARTPLIIAVGAEVKAGNIPEIEQVLSAGAAAMNMLNAIHLLGYGGMWVTGANSYDPQINKWLGFEAPSRLVGFLGVGTPKPLPADAPKIARPSRDRHTTEWMG